MQRSGYAGWLCALSLVVGACATVPRLQAPTVVGTALSIDKLAGTEAQFTVMLSLANPNDRDINIDAIEAEIRIEDVAVGTARSTAPLRLAAKGTAPVALAVRAGVVESLRAAAVIVRRVEAGGNAPPVLRYAVNGTATLEGGTSLPFSRSGELRLPSRMPAAR